MIQSSLHSRVFRFLLQVTAPVNILAGIEVNVQAWLLKGSAFKTFSSTLAYVMTLTSGLNFKCVHQTLDFSHYFIKLAAARHVRLHGGEIPSCERGPEAFASFFGAPILIFQIFYHYPLPRHLKRKYNQLLGGMVDCVQVPALLIKTDWRKLLRSLVEKLHGLIQILLPDFRGQNYYCRRQIPATRRIPLFKNVIAQKGTKKIQSFPLQIKEGALIGYNQLFFHPKGAGNSSPRAEQRGFHAVV